MTHLRDKIRTKVRRGWCRHNLHLMRGDNVRIKDGKRYCRECARAAARALVQSQKELGYRVSRCPVHGCKNAHLRSPQDPAQYVCPRHREAAA